MTPLATANTMGVAIISLVVIVGGYAGVYLLGHFMELRPSRGARADERRQTAEAPASKPAGPPRH
jgi:hypothetical protein